jgi:hypothetical protein
MSTFLATQKSRPGFEYACEQRYRTPARKVQARFIWYDKCNDQAGTFGFCARDVVEKSANSEYNNDNAITKMSLLDLIKATLVCGTGAFLSYSFPALCQAVLIGILFFLWLAYARTVLVRIRHRPK